MFKAKRDRLSGSFFASKHFFYREFWSKNSKTQGIARSNEGIQNSKEAIPGLRQNAHNKAIILRFFLVRRKIPRKPGTPWHEITNSQQPPIKLDDGLRRLFEVLLQIPHMPIGDPLPKTPIQSADEQRLPQWLLPHSFIK